MKKRSAHEDAVVLLFEHYGCNLFRVWTAFRSALTPHELEVLAKGKKDAEYRKLFMDTVHEHDGYEHDDEDDECLLRSKFKPVTDLSGWISQNVSRVMTFRVQE